MPIIFTCPFCKHSAKANDKAAGHRVRCPNCQSPLIIPAANQRESFPAEEIFEAPVAPPPVGAIVEFFCPSCNSPLQGFAGNKFNCKQCDQRVLVPLAPPPKENRTILGELKPFRAEASIPQPVLSSPIVQAQPPQIVINVSQVQAHREEELVIMPPPPPPPRPVSEWRCPFCQSVDPPFFREKISGDAWNMFVLLLIFFFPICWIPLVTMKQKFCECSRCGATY